MLETLFEDDVDHRAALERLCTRHPELESELRRRVARLEAYGVLESDAPLPPFPNVGDRFGPWTLVGIVGRGAMGVLFRARRDEADDGDDVALKLILPTLARAGRARFAREAQSLQRVDHPNVCRLVEFGETSSTPWIAMELIDGPSLADRIHEERNDLTELASIGETTRIAARLARGLAAVHAVGVVHRDVKPANVLLRGTGEPVLIDFGLALLEERAQITQSRRPIGTPAYMAPEQVRGERVDARADVYSLGAVLYEMLTLRPPFESASREDLFRRIVSDDVESPRRRNPAVPTPLARIIGKCLEKSARRRYEGAAELADDLDRFLHGRSVRARPPSVARRLTRRIRRHPAATLGAFVVALAFGLALAIARNDRLASAAYAGSLLSGLYAQRLGEAEALDVAAEAFVAHPSLQTRSQFYRTWLARRVSGTWSTDRSNWLHAAVSPDGSVLAIAAAPEQPERYSWVDATEGSPFERVLVAEGGHVEWDPEGVRLAVLVDENTVRVLTVGTTLTAVDHEIRGRIPSRSFSRPARCVAFAANGDVWVGSDDGEVHRLRGGEAERFEVFDDDDVLALEPEGPHLVAASRQGHVAVLDAEGEVVARPIDGELQRQVGIPRERADRVVLALDHRRLIVARGIDRRERSDECSLEVWSLPPAGSLVERSAELRVGPVDLHDRTIDLCVGPVDADGAVGFAALTRRGDLWTGGADGLTRSALGFAAPFSVSAHHGRFVLTSREGQVVLTEPDGHFIAHLAARADSVPLVVPATEGERVVAIARDGSTATIEIDPDDALVVRPPGDELYAARWGVREGQILTGTSPHRFATWTREGEKVVEQVLGDRQGLHRIAVGRTSGSVAVAVERVRGLMPGVGAGLQWLDPATLEVRSTNQGRFRVPRWRGLALSPDETTLFAVDGTQLVRLRRSTDDVDTWDLEQLAEEEGRFTFENVAATDDVVVTTGTDGRVEAWDVDGTSLARVRFESPPSAVAAYGDEAVVGFQDGSVRVLRLPTLATLRELERHPRRVTVTSISAPPRTGVSRRLAVGSAGGFVTILDGRTLQPWLEFDAAAGVVDLDWNEGGDELLVGTSDRRVRVLPSLDEETLRRRARKIFR